VVPNGDREVPAEGVLKLYWAEGWWPERTAEQVRAVLRAAPAVGAWHGQELIGFARSVTDGILQCQEYSPHHRFWTRQRELPAAGPDSMTNHPPQLDRANFDDKSRFYRLPLKNVRPAQNFSPVGNARRRLRLTGTPPAPPWFPRGT
jgi:hypothetical protein